jgi:hypothetical protein
LDPYSIGPVDPDPYSESGSGSRRAKMTHKRRKNSCFEVLDGLFCELQASSVTWTNFMEARDRLIAVFDQKKFNFFFQL